VAVPPWLETATFGMLGVLMLVDLLVVAGRPHAPSLRECSLWVAFYVGLALAFAAVLSAVSGAAVAGSFVAGWLTEYSLSVDNLFVFVIIMTRLAVPRGQQQRVLMIGIIVSLLLRGACILLGAAAVERCSWVFYLFGAFLVYSAVQLARGSRRARGRGHRENVVLRRARVSVVVSVRDAETPVIARRAGRRLLSPMMLIFLAIGSTDLLFALDSIPAIFGLTKDPFIVFTATLFALMGLRQLYFLLGGLLDRLVYLSVGLSVLLGFIGVKLVLEALHVNELPFLNGGNRVAWAPAIPIWLSLTVIFVVLTVTTLASLVSSRAGHAPAPARASQASANRLRERSPEASGSPASTTLPAPTTRPPRGPAGPRRTPGGG
jgi:tellurite resistance protein TerC